MPRTVDDQELTPVAGQESNTPGDTIARFDPIEHSALGRVKNIVTGRYNLTIKNNCPDDVLVVLCPREVTWSRTMNVGIEVGISPVVATGAVGTTKSVGKAKPRTKWINATTHQKFLDFEHDLVYCTILTQDADNNYVLFCENYAVNAANHKGLIIDPDDISREIFKLSPAEFQAIKSGA
mmetsp:Transcript_10595/g.26936  ORF Transcript_10595/g.26936 Transcript_10595/m.26936 type:complete len:180 (+) Transcript_10595:22-561(+)